MHTELVENSEERVYLKLRFSVKAITFKSDNPTSLKETKQIKTFTNISIPFGIQWSHAQIFNGGMKVCKE